MKNSTRIIELAGLAGAGKSTVIETLAQRNTQIRVEVHPYFKRISDLPFFVWNMLLILPTLVQLNLAKNSGRWLVGYEIVWMITLQGWHRRLKRRLRSSNQIIALDQGPVFMLMMLHLYGPDSLKGSTAAQWWDRMYKQWADTLDTVIWLDAENTILVERIRNRDRWHGVKDKNDADACEYLESYRGAYERVIALITASGNGVEVLKIDTGQVDLNGVINQIFLEVGLK